MKSLEIVNRKLNKLEMVHRDIDFTAKSLMEKQELETIKADLEVLEIIWKKRISMEYLWFLYDYYKDFTNGINYMLEKINEHQDETRKLTVEELLKIKQWLEENENE